MLVFLLFILFSIDAMGMEEHFCEFDNLGYGLNIAKKFDVFDTTKDILIKNQEDPRFSPLAFLEKFLLKNFDRQ